MAEMVGLILAAGSGERFEAPGFKQFHDLGGRPVLSHSLNRFETEPNLDEYLVLAPPDERERTKELVSPEERTKLGGVIEGANTRRKSVRRGLVEFSENPPELIVVHDAARPLVPPNLLVELQRVLEESSAEGVVPVRPVSDTVKRVDGDGRVKTTLDRDDLRLVQTPQLFLFTPLLNAHDQWPEDRPVTDDASMLEARGHTVLTTGGSEQLRKITHRTDLQYLEWLLENKVRHDG